MAAKAPEEVEYGGHDYEFVEKVPDKFICNICTKTLRDPHLTACCGQHFCQSCLENWFKKHGKKSCPHCREADFNHFLNKEKKREIGELKIHCTLRQEGCQWVGELDSLQTHLNSESGCGYVEVSCTNKCGKKMKRKDLKSHLAHSCPMRKCQCLYCNHIDTYQAISQHFSICPNLPLPCPNKCGDSNITRKNMSAHRETCPLEEVSCTNKCGLEMKRKDLEQHLTEQCRLRKYKCKHCGHEDTYQAITGEGYHPLASSHYDTCPNYPLPCPNKCGESNIKRKDMSAHREMCPLEEVNCINGCKEKPGRITRMQSKVKRMKRKDLKHHLTKECPLRMYKCEHCGHTDTYEAITTGKRLDFRFSIASHYDQCPKFPLDCPNRCGTGAIPRKDMSDHRAKCPLEPVECLFKEAGCEARLVRKDYDEHMTSNTQQHLLQTFQTQQRKTTELETLKKVIATDVKILREHKQPQASIALESIQTQLELKTSRLTEDGEQLTIRMPNFSHYKQSGKVWHSPPFYYKMGYKMRLAVYANGTGAGAGTHVSVSLLLLRGEFDDRLTWNEQEEDIMIQLLAQKQKVIQVEPSITISLYLPTTSLQRVPDGEDSRVVESKEKFADHKTVQQYNLLQDSIVLRVMCIPLFFSN